MSKSAENSHEREAYHESGHAVMSILLAESFVRVSLRTERRELFEIKNSNMEPVSQAYDGGLTWREDDIKSANENIFDGKLDLRQAIIGMAGPEAERMLIRKFDDEIQKTAEGDMNAIAACCCAAISPGLPMEKWQVSVMVGDIVQALVKQAHKLLRENWVCVEAVAEALIKKRSLTYEEAVIIVYKMQDLG